MQYYQFFIFSIPVSIRSIVYCTAIREGGHKEWKFAFENLIRSDFTSSENDYEKTNLLKALGCSAKPWLSTKYVLILLLLLK